MNTRDSNFDFLVDYITTRVAQGIMRDQNIELEEALLQFHNSETFEKLCEKGTDLYIESPAYVHELFKDELRLGSLCGLTE